MLVLCLSSALLRSPLFPAVLLSLFLGRFEVELTVSAVVVAMVRLYLYPVLHDGNPFPTAIDDISVHGLNGAVMLVEYALNNLHLRCTCKAILQPLLQGFRRKKTHYARF